MAPRIKTIAQLVLLALALELNAQGATQREVEQTEYDQPLETLLSLRSPGIPGPSHPPPPSTFSRVASSLYVVERPEARPGKGVSDTSHNLIIVVPIVRNTQQGRGVIEKWDSLPHSIPLIPMPQLCLEGATHWPSPWPLPSRYLREKIPQHHSSLSGKGGMSFLAELAQGLSSKAFALFCLPGGLHTGAPLPFELPASAGRLKMDAALSREDASAVIRIAEDLHDRSHTGESPYQCQDDAYEPFTTRGGNLK
ncbi:unnamed protein product [Lota lota]